jgi:hypothetical protein
MSHRVFDGVDLAVPTAIFTSISGRPTRLVAFDTLVTEIERGSYVPSMHSLLGLGSPEAVAAAVERIKAAEATRDGQRKARRAA